MSAVLNQPVVIDNGTGIIKAGFAGADKPKVSPRVRLQRERLLPH